MLHVHRAERADGLIDALRALLAVPLPDPFAPEVVAVPARGVERWLTQRLSDRLGAGPHGSDGVCANVLFPAPGRLIGDALALASGIDPDTDPWLPERLLWPLLSTVEESLREPWLAQLAAHLDQAPERRLGVVARLAELFHRYATQRPELVGGWASGDDDGWQARLWRRLRAEIAVPDPATRLAAACARLRAEPALVDLPARISAFGLTRLPAGQLHVLAALAAGRDVHLWLLHPSASLWERIGRAPRSRRRRDDVTRQLPVNPLLASWGHDARELQLVVGGVEHSDRHHPVEHSGDTLLARIQADVRADRSPPGPPLPGAADARPPLADDDRSVQVHACHGRARQVEVLRDAILQLLADDPCLQPRDVIVLCPDIETFAPLIEATFGAGELSDGPDRRSPQLLVRLADRGLRQTNPILGVVARLLDLVTGRVTASDVLDLADREPIRRRFGFDDDAIARIEQWVAQSGIRWGIDAAHRAPYKLAELSAGTWRAGLDRLLAGVALAEDGQRLFAGVLPLDDVDSGAIELAGRLAELVDRLDAALSALAPAQPIGVWAERIAAAADALTATSERDAWQRAELHRILDSVVAEAAGATARLSPLELRALLADRLRGRPTRAGFCTGHLTICTLVPMRSVPHRVVCLLGLDDGAFPRRAPRDGDDLMLADPLIGERDPRMEDRQLLLDALMAATERLLVTYTGGDERTNAVRPPAVPVGELLELIDRTVRVDSRTRVVVRHPLQPFDARNFSVGALVPGRAWSFDRVMRAGAAAARGPRAAAAPFLKAPLPALSAAQVELDDLVAFTAHPVRAFLRQRLGVGGERAVDELADALAVELDGPARWEVGQRLLDARLAGVDARTAALAEIARGTLPPGVLGQPVITAVHAVVEAIVERSRAGPLGSLDVRLELADGRRLAGTVPGVDGDVLWTITYSRLSPRHRLAAWVRLLAATLAHPDRRLEAVTIGRGNGDAHTLTARVGPLPAALARAQLAALVDLRDRGLREPLPLYCRTSAAYAIGADPADCWESANRRDGEQREPEHLRVLGGAVPFARLLEAPPRSDERWEARESTRFGALARRLWSGLLEREELSR